MTNEEKRKCDNCKELNFLIYDCIYEKHFCPKCNECKPNHPDDLMEKAFKKLKSKHMRNWF